MNIRQEVEKTVATFAAAQSLAVAYEGVPFTKPTAAPFVALMFLGSNNHNSTVDGEHTRRRGIVQIEAYVPTGKGMKALDDLTDKIVALFPFKNKELYQTFSVEGTPEVSAAFQDGSFMCAVVRVSYRQEL